MNLIEGFKAGRIGRRTICVGLPLLTVLWVNLHSGYLFGVVLCAAYAGGELGELLLRRSADRRRTWTHVKLFTFLAGVCFAVAVLNPNGWHLWTYPFGTLGSAAMQANIDEWRSPDFHRYIYWPFALMMVLGVLSWVSGVRRPSCTDVLLFLGSGAAGLLSSRHIALFAVVATPIVARSVMQVLHRTTASKLIIGQIASRSVGSNRARLNWTILAVGLLATSVWTIARLQRNEEAIAKVYPSAAVEFLQREGLAQSRGYNTYAWGGYLIWHGLPVFVDGRADVYGDDFLFSYLKTLRLTDEWSEPLERFDVTYVLVERSNPLGTLLVASGDWDERYADDVARLFVRSADGSASTDSNNGTPINGGG